MDLRVLSTQAAPTNGTGTARLFFAKPTLHLRLSCARSAQPWPSFDKPIVRVKQGKPTDTEAFFRRTPRAACIQYRHFGLPLGPLKEDQIAVSIGFRLIGEKQACA
jgi:hypothetical protein